LFSAGVNDAVPAFAAWWIGAVVIALAATFVAARIAFRRSAAAT
jgi:hypothetical protein